VNLFGLSYLPVCCLSGSDFCTCRWFLSFGAGSDSRSWSSSAAVLFLPPPVLFSSNLDFDFKIASVSPSVGSRFFFCGGCAFRSAPISIAPGASAHPRFSSVDFVFDSAPATAFFCDDFLLGDFGSQLVRVSSVQFLAQGSFLPPLRALAGSAQDPFFLSSAVFFVR
jgi:hypothetical protein